MNRHHPPGLQDGVLNGLISRVPHVVCDVAFLKMIRLNVETVKCTRKKIEMLLIHRRDVSREELHTWKDPDGRSWERNLSPLIQAIGQRYRDFLPRQTYPIRTGVHPNTAFGITFATVYHKDSLGNSGTLGSGDIQWMTAGSAILHQEIPRGNEQGKMHGFQLWANLPSSLKMTDPRYQGNRLRNQSLRSHCDEYAGRAAAGVDGPSERHVHQKAVSGLPKKKSAEAKSV